MAPGGRLGSMAVGTRKFGDSRDGHPVENVDKRKLKLC